MKTYLQMTTSRASYTHIYYRSVPPFFQQKQHCRLKLKRMARSYSAEDSRCRKFKSYANPISFSKSSI